VRAAELSEVLTDFKGSFSPWLVAFYSVNIPFVPSPTSIADPVFVFLFFRGCVGISHVLFIFLYKLTTEQWRLMDYIWISLTAIGLFATAAQVRNSMNQRLIPLSVPPLVTDFKILRDLLDTYTHAFCGPHVRSDLSPPNFDAIEEERKIVCDWLKGVVLTLPDRVEPDFPELTMPAPPNVDEEVTINGIRGAFNSYNKLRREREALLAATKSNSFEEIIYTLGPLLTSVGLAIRFTKVTGELLIDLKAKEAIG
jgi:hypothetical protein